MTSGDSEQEQDPAPNAAPGPNADTRSNVDIHLSTDTPDLCPSEESLRHLAIRVMEGENVSFRTIGIILADHDVVTDLNRRYLNHDWQTDVISFRLSDETPLEGEVYVDVQTADERCSEFGTTAREEILRYTAHGLLHLTGYDDATADERARMRQLEDRYLSQGPSAD